MCARRPARPRNTSSHEPMARGHPVSMRLLDNALSAGKQDMPRGGTENDIAINTTRRTTGRIKFCFIRHVQCLTRTIKTNGSENSDLRMDDVTQLFPQISVGRRFTFPTYEFWHGARWRPSRQCRPWPTKKRRRSRKSPVRNAERQSGHWPNLPAHTSATNRSRWRICRGSIR